MDEQNSKATLNSVGLIRWIAIRSSEQEMLEYPPTSQASCDQHCKTVLAVFVAAVNNCHVQSYLLSIVISYVSRVVSGKFLANKYDSRVIHYECL